MGLNSGSRLSSEGELCVCRNLQQTLSNSSLLRSMTGEWFYQSKQLRHQDRIHGTDIIRASIRQTQRPPTLSESVATPAQGGGQRGQRDQERLLGAAVGSAQESCSSRNAALINTWSNGGFLSGSGADAGVL